MCTLTSKYVTMRIFAQRVYNQDNNQELVIWFNVDTIQWGTKTTQYITTIDHIDNNYIDDSYHDMDYLSKQDTLQQLITITLAKITSHPNRTMLNQLSTMSLSLKWSCSCIVSNGQSAR